LIIRVSKFKRSKESETRCARDPTPIINLSHNW
jgi:hypothetical protein